MPQDKSRAVVIGASFAGMAAARCLSEHFKEVLVVDRDDLASGPEFRAGVPQGRHTHVLLRRGQDVFEKLFPGFTESLVQRGAHALNWGSEVRWYHHGGWKLPHHVDFSTVSCTRLLVEDEVRSRLQQIGNIWFLKVGNVTGLISRPNADDVGGVLVQEKGQGAERAISADLVVDASGRASKAPAWLQQLGYEPPAELRVNAFLGYATRLYEAPSQKFPWKTLLLHPTPPHNSRLGIIFPVEGGRWQVTLAGINKDYPPTEEKAFLEFARGLASTELHAALTAARPLSTIHGYRRTENQWRQYHKVKKTPSGFIALGDAVCAFNPVYGQGISTAALGAEVLGDCLKGGIDGGFSQRFQRTLAGKLRLPWYMATSEDFRYSATEGGKATAATKLVQRYLDRVVRRTVYDAAAYEKFLRVLHMVDSPAVLMSPKLAWRTLFARQPMLNPNEQEVVTHRLVTA